MINKVCTFKFGENLTIVNAFPKKVNRILTVFVPYIFDTKLRDMLFKNCFTVERSKRNVVCRNLEKTASFIKIHLTQTVTE